jgi:hypothetical protein
MRKSLGIKVYEFLEKKIGFFFENFFFLKFFWGNFFWISFRENAERSRATSELL